MIYNKIKYKDELYALGDFLVLSDSKEGSYIAQLIKIFPSGGIAKYHYWPSIEVLMYFILHKKYLGTIAKRI